MPCFYWGLLVYLQLAYHFTNVDPNNHIMNLLVFFSCPIGNTVKPYLNIWMKIPKLFNTLSQVLLVASIDHLLLVIEIAFTPHQIIKEEIIQPRLVFWNSFINLLFPFMEYTVEEIDNVFVIISQNEPFYCLHFYLFKEPFHRCFISFGLISQNFLSESHHYFKTITLEILTHFLIGNEFCFSIALQIWPKQFLE